MSICSLLKSSSRSKLARGRGASCRRDLRGFGLLPAAGLATLPAADRICATYLVRRSRPQQRVVDEMPPALHNADPISDDGRTAGAAASSTGWEPAARPSEVLGAAAIAREQGRWRPEVVRRRAEAVQRGRVGGGGGVGGNLGSCDGNEENKVINRRLPDSPTIYFFCEYLKRKK